MQKQDKHFICQLLILALLAVIAYCLTGCKTPAPVVQTHTRDSIRTEYRYQKDTTYIDRWHTITQKGDTVFRTDSIYQYVGEKVEVHDTIDVSTHDTITNVEYVEKELTGVQQAAMNSGYASWALIVLLIIAGIVSVIIKK